MIKTYIIVVVLFIIMTSTVVYGFIVTGSPFASRGLKFDQIRVSDINNLSGSIDGYYRQNKKLPEKLSDLSSVLYPAYPVYNKNKDPETNKEYEYTPTGQTTYKLCANFAAASDDQKESFFKKYSGYQGREFTHPKGYYCFELEVPSNVINQNTYTSAPSSATVKKTTTYQDNKIELITTNTPTSQIQNSNFPFGFFSNDQEEWGLINYANEPVVVIVKFKELVKIKSISNIFTHCHVQNCYTWDAVGIKEDGNAQILVSPTLASENIESKQIVSSAISLKEVRIVVNRTGGSDKFVHWKKIKFEYY